MAWYATPHPDEEKWVRALEEAGYTVRVNRLYHCFLLVTESFAPAVVWCGAGCSCPPERARHSWCLVLPNRPAIPVPSPEEAVATLKLYETTEA